jgi:iron-regulated transporter 1
MDLQATVNTTGSLASSLYVSHFLSMWNSRGFEFGAVLFLASMYPGTLLPMSIYALVRALAAILLSPKVGTYIDNAHRLHVVRISIVGQRAAVILSCGLFSIALRSHQVRPDYSSLLIFALLVIFACFEKLFAIMNTVAIERDWVVVIAADNEGLLQTLNAQMRRIDLICKLLSPLGIALLHSWSPRLAVWVTLAINAVSVLVEYWFIAKVFRTVPSLSQHTSTPTEICDGVGADTALSNFEESSWFHCAPFRRFMSSLWAPLITYMRQAGFLPSLALSVLYLTVLSFSGQMITFLLAMPSPKITPGTIGLVRTVSTLSELSSTFAAPAVMSRIGPVRAGIWFLSWQAITLSPAVYVLWTGFVGIGQASLPFFIIALILSRFGLWSFDLCAQLIIQESVLPSQRGLFSSVEASLQNFFELCAFTMTIVFPKPQQFCYPALVSLLAVYCSAVLYAKFVRDRRGHLLHMPACLKSDQIGDGNNYEPLPADPELPRHFAGSLNR